MSMSYVDFIFFCNLVIVLLHIDFHLSSNILQETKWRNVSSSVLQNWQQVLIAISLYLCLSRSLVGRRSFINLIAKVIWLLVLSDLHLSPLILSMRMLVAS